MLTDDIEWRIQLNVRNVGQDNDLIPDYCKSGRNACCLSYPERNDLVADQHLLVLIPNDMGVLIVALL